MNREKTKKVSIELTVEEIDQVLSAFNYALNTAVFRTEQEVLMVRVAKKFYKANLLKDKSK